MQLLFLTSDDCCRFFQKRKKIKENQTSYQTKISEVFRFNVVYVVTLMLFISASVSQKASKSNLYIKIVQDMI